MPSTPEGLQALADSLVDSDRVVLEMTGSAWEIVRILEPHVARVMVVSPGDTGIAHARAKTDRFDARTLARLLWVGELDAIWMPDERTRVLRRRFSHREQLVRSRTRCKNEMHAVLMRRLIGRCPHSDMFGKAGRNWLRSLELAVEECETVEAAMRQIEFLDAEIAEVERLIARERCYRPTRGSADRARGQPDLRGDVPGRDRRHPPVHDLAAAGRLPRPGSEGPPVRLRAAPTGRISKQGSPQARWALVEATHSVVRQPGPLRAFHQRIRARRGYQIATVAAARKLACLFWCLLTRDEHYAHAQPSLTAKKLRKLELIAGAKRFDRSATGIYSTNEAMRKAERSSPNKPRRPTRGWSATGKRQHRENRARARHRSAHINRPSKGKAARQTQSS